MRKLSDINVRVKLRQVEFGRATLARLLDERKPQVWYFGMLRAEHDEAKNALGTLLYNYWDNSSGAPSKQRPREAEEAPSLQALVWHNGEAKFPDALVNKFPADSFERERLLKLKALLEDTFVSSVPSAAVAISEAGPPGALVRSPSTQSVVRAIGRPDWTIEDGKTPIALDQEIHLEHVPAASFGVSRPASVIFVANLIVTCIVVSHFFKDMSLSSSICRALGGSQPLPQPETSPLWS